MTNPSRLDLLQGTLDLLILRTLQSGDAVHGWASCDVGQGLQMNMIISSGLAM